MADEVKPSSAPSFSDALNAKSKPKEPADTAPAPDPKPPKVDDAPAPLKTEGADVPPVDQAPQPNQPKPAPLSQAQGLLAALQAERGKRQSLEDRLRELETPTYEEPVAETPAGPELDLRTLDMSEYMARQAHPDYDENYQVFAEAAAENPALLQTVLQAKIPAEAAYQTGRMVKFQKKYGTDPDGVVKAIEAEVRAKLEPELRKSIMAELEGKVVARSKTPTNILQQRAANGSASAAFVPPSFAEALNSRRK